MRICLAYPNHRLVGSGNLGFQKIFKTFAELPVVEADVCFLPENSSPPRSESLQMELGRFDSIGFSLTFEMDYVHFLQMLQGAGIPLLAEQRGDKDPLIFAGGVALTMNPEPLWQFVDFFILGEGEVVLEQVVAIMQKTAREPRQQRLKQLAAVDGLYVPSLYKVEENEHGYVSSRQAMPSAKPTVRRLISHEYMAEGMAQLERFEDTVFKGSFLMETGKGCSQGCRFCAAGFIYRPTRHVDVGRLKKQAEAGLKREGRIGLVGSAICEHPDIAELYSHILSLGGDITVSSLRLGLLDEPMLRQLATGGLKTVTLAPEAGSLRLRRVVNKNISDDCIVDAIAASASAGIPNVKLYFLFGLPTEQDEDIEKLAALCKRARDRFLTESKPYGRAGKITVSLNPFLPKPNTPFQWQAMQSVKELKRKAKMIKQLLRAEPNIELKVEGIRGAAVQTLLSIGGRSVSSLLLRRLNGEAWNSLMKLPLAESIVYRAKMFDEQMPWDFIDVGVSKKYLQKEAERAGVDKITPACPVLGSGCSRCGDFKGFCS